MNRRSMLRSTLLGLGGLAAGRAEAAGSPPLPTPPIQPGNTDRGYPDDGVLEIVAEFMGPGPSGVAVTPDGRIFVSFPRHADDHPGATLCELRDGVLTPFPSRAMSDPSDAAPRDYILSAHGIALDAKNRLWIIDNGKRAGHPIPDGGAKVMGFDVETGAVIASIPLLPPVLLPDSHMNDLRIDLTHGAAGTAFVTDSSFGTSPAFVVVDIASGRSRRVLAHHPSTNAEPGFMVVQEGRPLVYDPAHPSFTVGGVDGITLSPDSGTVFYSALTSRKLFSIPSALLADPNADDAALAKGIRYEGEKGVADGLAHDAEGRIYTTNFEHDAILRRNTDGSFDSMVHDPRIVSPDGITTTATHVYCTLGQWNRLKSFNGGKDLRRPPYLLIRVPLAHPLRFDAAAPDEGVSP